MRLLTLVVLACAVTAGAAADRTRRQASCRDYARRSGTCGAIQQCPALFSLISNGRRPSSQEVQNIRRSRCRVGPGPFMVCCARTSAPPRDSGGFTSRPTISAGYNGAPEQHPNRAILDAGQACGLNIANRIVGGTEVPIGKYPWVALLGYTSPRTPQTQYLCGGSLISRQHVLTAAHCVAGVAPLQLTTVRLGEHEIGRATDCQEQPGDAPICNSPEDFRVSTIMVHSGFNLRVPQRQRSNDIALLKLDRPVTEGFFISKVCLPFGDIGRRNLAGVSMMAAGFGRTGPQDTAPSSSVLLEVTLPGVDQQSCAATIRNLQGNLGPQQLCAGGQQGRDSCGGDSGGPLMLADRFSRGPPYSLVGIISFGNRFCGNGGVPSVNTRVSEYLNWILDRLDD
ncbi:CLIP domain-containing serine protease 14D-like [Pollicipes pollicipes]|uniref:CLIP domain-containing serine protease 14D-like n=1 Tax=Pollicipes pollicipes TaxID=41117 RepID=UPI001884A5E4|nr:CLIP domain-containing serine protease 14D-like [Pollicipes pollicipes]